MEITIFANNCSFFGAFRLPCNQTGPTVVSSLTRHQQLDNCILDMWLHLKPSTNWSRF
jgi:hypothetical protein